MLDVLEKKEGNIMSKIERPEKDRRFIISKERDKRNWTQEQLAEKLGVSREHVNRIENGKKNLCFKMLMKILEVLELNADDFLFICDSECESKNDMNEIRNSIYQIEAILEEIEKKI